MTIYKKNRNTGISLSISLFIADIYNMDFIILKEEDR